MFGDYDYNYDYNYNGGWGPKQNFNFNFKGFGPKFERGDIKLVILDLLREKPSHGYEIMQALEKRFHGLYTPSSGTIYPTLQLLEDQDMITSDQKSGKKIYTITQVGLDYLESQKVDFEKMQERLRGSFKQPFDFMKVMKDELNHEELKKTLKLLFENFRNGNIDDEKKKKLHAAFHDFIEQVEKIVKE